MTTHQDFDSSHLEVSASLHRIQNKSPKKTSKRFVERPFIDFLLLLTTPTAAWLLLALFQPAFDVANIVAQLDNGAIIIGLPTLVLSLVGLVWRLRWRVNHYQPWHNDACPSCQSAQLKRKRRRYGDRLLGRLGIPVRRYICADCHWQGRLIDKRRVL